MPAWRIASQIGGDVILWCFIALPRICFIYIFSVDYHCRFISWRVFAESFAGAIVKVHYIRRYFIIFLYYSNNQARFNGVLAEWF